MITLFVLVLFGGDAANGADPKEKQPIVIPATFVSKDECEAGAKMLLGDVARTTAKDYQWVCSPVLVRK